MEFREHTYYDGVDGPLVMGLTTRHGGVSSYPEQSLNMAHYIDDTADNVIANQQKLAEEISFDRQRWVFPIQTHGNQVIEVTEQHAGTNIDQLTSALHGYDGLYTSDKNVLLTMCFADCVPVYFYSEQQDFVGLAHAGWRGTLVMVSRPIIEAYHTPESLHCIIGPSICSDCYEVNEEVKKHFNALPFPIESFFTERENGLYGIDLQGLNAEIAVYAGIKREHISFTSQCTATCDQYFSYRIEKGQTGRMLAFIGMRDQ